MSTPQKAPPPWIKSVIFSGMVFTWLVLAVVLPNVLQFWMAALILFIVAIGDCVALILVGKQLDKLKNQADGNRT